ncbi:MAG: complement resistance protein TraT [Nitrospirota bacterium]
MRYLVLSVLLSLPFAACASNIKDTDLLTSNTLMLPPAKANTVFLQNRNSSDNQAVTLSDLGSRLTAKGYQVVQDPNIAYYIVLTNIVYCNLTKTELPVQDMVASGYGSGIGSSIMGGLQGLTSMASMAGPQGMIIGSVASTVLDVGSSVGSLFSGGPSRPSANENMNYACVADLQITERKLGESLPTERQVAPSPGVYQTRLAASVDQKKLDEPEATPLVHQKLSAAVAGHF